MLVGIAGTEKQLPFFFQMPTLSQPQWVTGIFSMSSRNDKMASSIGNYRPRKRVMTRLSKSPYIFWKNVVEGLSQEHSSWLSSSIMVKMYWSICDRKPTWQSCFLQTWISTYPSTCFLVLAYQTFICNVEKTDL